MKRNTVTEHYNSLEDLRTAWGLKPVPFKKRQQIKRIPRVNNWLLGQIKSQNASGSKIHAYAVSTKNIRFVGSEVYAKNKKSEMTSETCNCP